MKLTFFLVIFLLSTQPLDAEVLKYDDLIKDALEYSYDLQSAAIDRQIKNKIYEETKYGLYPELQVKINSEYVHDLTENAGLTSVGGTVLSDSTKYQNSTYINLTHTLFDAGVTKQQLHISRIDAEVAQYTLNKIKMDIRLSVLEKYSKLLSAYTERHCRKRLAEMMTRLNKLENRSRNAGITDEIAVVENRIEYAENQGALLDTEHGMVQKLEELSLLTGRSYRLKELKLAPLEHDRKQIKKSDSRKHPEYKIYEKKFLMREKEAGLVKRSFYPSIELYMRYTWYGMDEDDYHRSFDDIRSTNYTAGIFTSIPLVETIQKRHRLNRARLEMNKAELAMKSKYDELAGEFRRLHNDYSYYQRDVSLKRNMVDLVRDKNKMLERMANAKLIDITTALKERMALVKRELELEKEIIREISALKQIQIEVSQ